MSCKKNISRGCCFGKTPDGVTAAKATAGCNKMETWDWLEDLPNPMTVTNIYEIQFKNTRKGFYALSTTMNAPKKGDIVVVESSPGHDVGIITLTGDMVAKQMRRTGFNPVGAEFKKIIRPVSTYDIERWQEAISMEYDTMIRSREIVSQLGLNMKIGDVEYQGDKLKAIFYYIADQRVDFRELIKILAEQFRIRVEMKQIGARQEAGRIGGISACGRELCCATWQNNFSTVTIGAARHQDISLNPQKLAGQCGKLKCCLNYEVDNYIDARKDFPRINGPLDAMDGSYYLVKSDIFGKIMWFSPSEHNSSILIPLGIDRVRKIIAMNRKGVKVDKLEDVTLVREVEVVEPAFENVVGQESITRFDRSKSVKRSSGHGRDSAKGGDTNSEGATGSSPQAGANQRPSRGPRNEARVAKGDDSTSNVMTERTQQNGDKPNSERNGNERQNGERSNGEKSGNRNNRNRNNRNRASANPDTVDNTAPQTETNSESSLQTTAANAETNTEGTKNGGNNNRGNNNRGNNRGSNNRGNNNGGNNNGGNDTGANDNGANDTGANDNQGNNSGGNRSGGNNRNRNNRQRNNNRERGAGSSGEARTPQTPPTTVE